MKKADRILKHVEFAEIREKGKRHKTESHLLYYRNNETGRARVGVSVSKKNGDAVTRNLIKRQIRAAVDGNLDYSSSLDLIIVARFGYDPGKGLENMTELAGALDAIGASKIGKEKSL